MADGDYERRGGREAELKRLARILAEARAAKAAPPVRVPAAPKEA